MNQRELDAIAEYEPTGNAGMDEVIEAAKEVKRRQHARRDSFADWQNVLDDTGVDRHALASDLMAHAAGLRQNPLAVLNKLANEHLDDEQARAFVEGLANRRGIDPLDLDTGHKTSEQIAAQFIEAQRAVEAGFDPTEKSHMDAFRTALGGNPALTTSQAANQALARATGQTVLRPATAADVPNAPRADLETSDEVEHEPPAPEPQKSGLASIMDDVRAAARELSDV